MQASTSVQHMVLPCHWSQRNQMLPDLVRCYGACGRTIIFTETKRDANELLNVLSEARALHGDIPQACLPLAACATRTTTFCDDLCPMATGCAVSILASCSRS